MGDTPGGPEPLGDGSNPPLGSRHSPSNPSPYDESETRRDGQSGSQSSTLQRNYPPMQRSSSHQSLTPGRQDSFNMASIGNALDSSYPTYSNIQPQRYPPGASPSAVLYQLPNAAYTGQPAMIPPAQNLPYHVQYQSQYPAMYGHTQTPSSQNLQSGAQFYQGQGFIGQPQQPRSPFFANPGQYATPSHLYPTSPAAGQYGGRGRFAGDFRLAGQQRSSEHLSAASGGTAATTPGRSSSIASSSGQSSVVRGPPRKPRQSGHAIWIGNLPPQTDLMSLVLHVCKETSGLQSLFLISKSNCAFANFKDEASCATAQTQIHDSRFQTVRLVSRLRRSSVGTAAGVAVPTGPAALTPPSNPLVARTPSPDRDSKSKDVSSQVTEVNEIDGSNLPRDKFFIVKSLTVEDLELSIRNGIWATQSHNEEALNKAYQTADNVYLIFSANKSGEYFGYAKMASPINDDPAAAIEFAPKAHAVEDPELPRAIPTPATEFAPKGRIIDDSARGTIFWEVERDEIDGAEEDDDENRSSRSDQDLPLPSKAWGKPFQVEWISTTRLPFYRTRGLRNPWNSNREVKIARDGTELETTIGRRLIGLFHRLPSPSGHSAQGGSIPMVGNHPQMRQL